MGSTEEFRIRVKNGVGGAELSAHVVRDGTDVAQKDVKRGLPAWSIRNKTGGKEAKIGYGWKIWLDAERVPSEGAIVTARL